MKVTHVSIRPTEAALNAPRPSLTPELLAATGARYSRNNEGLESILAKIDPDNLDKSVDGIFRMIDYGHQSIADMAPIAMFIDGLSMLLAYLVWSQVPTAGGQESSTRYLRLTADDLPNPSELGVPESMRNHWQESIGRYEIAYSLWDAYGKAHPEATRIPRELLDDPGDKAQKQVGRMQRNFAFDRARYFLPVALRTNMMLVMSARGWVQLSQWLLSHTLPEAQRLGTSVVQELGLSAPRLLRHATAKASIANGLKDEFEDLKQPRQELPDVSLSVMLPNDVSQRDIARALAHHDNRYAYFGDALRRTAVRFAWRKMAFAEIRDLNRHRTGSKYCPLHGLGFYGAEDEIPPTLADELGDLNARAEDSSRLGPDHPAYPYHYLLGTQFHFEHTTTADKFIYEAELRTGTGAHFRYAKHLHDALTLWYDKFPETRGLVLEGHAEPE